MTTLKLRNKRWYPFIFLVGAAAAIAVLHPALGNKPELVVSSIGAVAAFTFFLYKQHLDETRLFKELFDEFNKRYYKMSEGLNEIVYGTQQCEPSEPQKKLLFKYLNLCSEEYLFYKAGYIDNEVWNSWQKGMEDVFKHIRGSAFWEREKLNDSYYGFRLK